jgi:DNA (cytosine-5)-methyltransferase 1
MKVLDLFSGIGGFSLGFERAGMETVAFCEVDKKCRKVLHKHWPNVKCYTDIKELTHEQLQADGIIPEVICGGFPCQDVSFANSKGKGIEGERSGLWSEMFRLIKDVRPSWAVIENVSALRSKGLALVLQNLCEISYVSEFHCIPASAVGAPHQRDRIWILAHPNGEGLQGHSEALERPSQIRTQKETRLLSCVPRSDFWASQSSVCRVANGISGRVDRLKQLGNSVCPQLTEVIGCAIMKHVRSKND